MCIATNNIPRINKLAVKLIIFKISQKTKAQESNNIYNDNFRILRTTKNTFGVKKMIYIQDRLDILSSDGGLSGTLEVAGVTDTTSKD